MDKKIQKMPLIDDEDDEMSNEGWFKQNRSMVIAIVIIVVLIGGIYALSKKEASVEVSEKAQEEMALEEGVSEQEVSSEGEVASKQEEVAVKEGEVKKDEIVEYAEKGEGVTHLARKAVNRYANEVNKSANLSNEQKIYVEDYLQNRTSSKGLEVGERVSFSKGLVEEAIEASKNLTPAQLENLKKYSRVVYPSEV